MPVSNSKSEMEREPSSFYFVIELLAFSFPSMKTADFETIMLHSLIHVSEVFFVLFGVLIFRDKVSL